jgi:outer membrane protein assembly factor BamB
MNPRQCILSATAVASVAVLTSSALGDGTVAWRFRMNATYAAQRGSVASDGTVYFQDISGVLYAFSPAGQLLWTYNTGGQAEGPIAIGGDGTIYVSGNPVGADVQIHAVNPDGTNRWTFTDPGVTQGIIAGPALGPDGNLYAVTEFSGLGALSISAADGQLRWSNPGNPAFVEHGQTGAEITFGSQTPGGAVDQFFVAFDMSGSASPTGLLYGFSLNGSQDVTFSVGGDANVGQFQPAAGAAQGAVYVSSLQSNQGYRLRAFNADSGSALWTYPSDDGPPTNTLTQPTVGPDGTIYVMCNLGQIHAVNPNGSNRWTHSTNLMFLNAPIADPTNRVVVAPGRITFGEPGFVRGLDPSNGQMLWHVSLPDDSGVRMIPFSRPWFSADGRRAYITTTLPGSSAGGFLYAIDLAPPAVPGDVDDDGDVDLADLSMLLTAFGSCSGDPGYNVGADFNASGCVDLSDLATLLANYGT